MIRGYGLLPESPWGGHWLGRCSLSHLTSVERGEVRARRVGDDGAARVMQGSGTFGAGALKWLSCGNTAVTGMFTPAGIMPVFP